MAYQKYKFHAPLGRGYFAKVWPLNYIVIVYFLLNLLLYSDPLYKDQTKLGYSNDIQGRNHQNYKFHDSQDKHSCAMVWQNKMHYFNKNLFFSSLRHWSEKLSIIMITKKESTKIINFKTPGAGFLALARGYIVSMQYVYTMIWNRPIKCKAIMIKDGSAKIVHFITIRAGVSC